MKMRSWPFAAVLATVLLPPAVGAQPTSAFDVSMTVVPDCIISATGIDFGQAQGVLAGVVSGSGSVRVTCTNTTPFKVGLDDGNVVGPQAGTRYMESATTSSKLAYELFHDTATARWGNTPDTDTVGGTGDGRLQIMRIRGEVPMQDSPAPGFYRATVTATVFF